MKVEYLDKNGVVLEVGDRCIMDDGGYEGFSEEVVIEEKNGKLIINSPTSTDDSYIMDLEEAIDEDSIQNDGETILKTCNELQYICEEDKQ